MVVQGVKNPLVDLLSLEDKTLDEVRLSEMISQLQPLHVTTVACLSHFLFLP